MLVITRKPGEVLMVGDIEIHVNEVRNDIARLAIKAPKEMKILRGELVERDRKESEQRV